MTEAKPMSEDEFAELEEWADVRLFTDGIAIAQRDERIEQLKAVQKRLCDALRPLDMGELLGNAINPVASDDTVIPTITTLGERRRATALLREVDGG